MKRYYTLKPNQATHTPSNILYFDTEGEVETKDVSFTLNEIQLEDTSHKLKLGVAIYRNYSYKKEKYWEKVYRFSSEEEFYNIVIDRTRDCASLWVMSHNLGYDLPIVGIIPKLVKDGWDCQLLIASNSATVIKFRKDKRTIVFCDTFNFFRMSVEAMGKILGSQKIKVDFNEVSKEQLYEYCEQDTRIIADVFSELLFWWKKNGFGNFAYTIASLSMNAFRHKYLPEKKILKVNSPIAERLESQAYFGGRTEVFFRGSKNEELYKLDVNSMYPFFMRDKEMPVKGIAYYDNVSKEDLKEYLKDFMVIATVVVDIKEPKIPFRRDGKLLFPIGTFQTTLATPELKLLDIDKEVIEVKELAIYEKAIIFDKFVNELYAMRMKYKEEGNKVWEFFIKILLNSLSGKFAQRKYTTKKVAENREPMFYMKDLIDADTYKSYTKYQMGTTVYITYEDGYMKHANIAIIAHITSYARAYLWSLIKKAGRENVYYCDTDSLFVNKEGYERLKGFIDKKELGKLKLEGVTDRWEFRNLKDYSFDTEVKKKGLKKNAKKIGEETYKQKQFSKIGKYMKDTSGKYPKVYDIVKQYKREYDKGIVGKIGYVKPFIYTIIDGKVVIKDGYQRTVEGRDI